MTPADFTLPTPGANPLAVLPPRRRTGARVEPWISGVTAVERNKILRPRNIGAYATGNSAKISTPEGPGTHNPILSEPVIALRTAVRSIIRSTSLSRYHFGTVFICVVGWSFSTWCISTKNHSLQDRAVHMKEKKKSFLLFFRSGAFLKILQDHKWNAKQGWGGCERSVEQKEASRGESTCCRSAPESKRRQP